MSTRNDATGGRTRRIGLIAALATAAWLLTGCSSSSSGDGADYYSGGDAGFAEEPAFAESDGEAVGGEDGAPSSPAGADRSVIVTGSMYMTVEDPIAAAEEATVIVQRAGGRVDSRSETAPDDYDGGSAWLTLRIPSDDLEAVVDDLRDLGTVDEYSTNSYDVTREVTDLDAQISTLRASTDRIEALLLRAEDIEDIITLEDELDDRQAELESLEARQRGLDDQVSLSTLDLSLTTEPVVVVDDSPRSFWDGLVAGWDALVGFLTGALVVLGVLLPWLVLLAIIALAVYGVIRMSLARSARRRADAAAAPAETVAAPPAPPAQPDNANQ